MIFKSNFLKYFFVAALLCALSFVSGIVLSPRAIRTPAPAVSALSSGTKQTTQADMSAPEETVSSGADKARTSGSTYPIARVVDGDTVDVLINGKSERVRYIGMDTPETVDPRKGVQCFGREASQKNKELVEGREVRLESDVTNRDTYGRMLRYVFVGDVFVNRELVRLGYASVYTFPPNIKHAQDFLAAEQEARKEQRGLWQACRQGKTASTSKAQSISPIGNFSTPSPVCSIKGNINVRGEKIYHVAGCSYYEKAVIDESKGERWFCSEDEALRAGWRKAGNCP